MDVRAFEQRTVETVELNGWNRAALVRLYVQLYLYAVCKVRRANGLRAGTSEWFATLYLVNLVIRQTPLGRLQFLKEDDDLRVKIPDDLLRDGRFPGIPAPARKRAFVEMELDGVMYWAAASWRACH